MNDYLEGKNVILIGPCNSLIGKNLGDFIDSFDIVVRIKRGYPVPESLYQDLGTKTNLLYTTLRLDNGSNNLTKKDVENINKNNILICYPQPLINQYQKMYKLFIKKYPNQKIILDKKKKYEDYFNFKNNTGCEPTIMTFTIMHLLNFNIKKLECIGFSFRKHGYYPEYKSLEKDRESYERTYNSCYHSIEKEKEFLKKLKKSDNRLILDTE